MGGGENDGVDDHLPRTHAILGVVAGLPPTTPMFPPPVLCNERGAIAWPADPADLRIILNPTFLQ